MAAALADPALHLQAWVRRTTVCASTPAAALPKAGCVPRLSTSWSTPIPDSSSPFSQPSGAGPLLNQVLDSLLDDFQRWFERGQDLLAYCPETVLGPTEQRDFDAMLTRSLQELMAARALRGAMSETLALDMQAMAPWHRLVMKVWGLSAALREAGVTLPPDRQKPALFPPPPPGDG